MLRISQPAPRRALGVVLLLGCAGATAELALLGGCAGATAELALPDVRQSTGWTCSAAALQAVLAYYGVDEREDRLSRELGATPESGAPPPAILRVARAHGLTAELREGLTVEELARAVAAGTPVLIALQAWGAPPASSRSVPQGREGARYRDVWDEGHYLVVIGVTRDRQRVIVEDPSLLGSRGFLTRRELEERWHDTDGKHRYVRMGIFFGGRRPAPPPCLQHVD